MQLYSSAMLLILSFLYLRSIRKAVAKSKLSQLGYGEPFKVPVL